jgi:hypothetical protein
MNINFTEHSKNDCTVFIDGNIAATGLTRKEAEISTQVARLTAEKCGVQCNSSFDTETTTPRITL